MIVCSQDLVPDLITYLPALAHLGHPLSPQSHCSLVLAWLAVVPPQYWNIYTSNKYQNTVMMCTTIDGYHSFGEHRHLHSQKQLLWEGRWL